jgi:serine/threonine protein kinase
MMSRILQARTLDHRIIEYVDEICGSGGMKDMYFTPDKKNVLLFFREPQTEQCLERLQLIVGRYRERIFNQEGGDYWQQLFRWPVDVVENDAGQLGIVEPVYQEHFFFKYGSINNDFLDIKGHEKEGKWFASPTNRYKYLDPKERGDWLSYLRICILISRAVRRLHAAGLAHSDLSYKNVLVDPEGGHACIVDIDGLVVPGKFPPDVAGTPDFFAPEVVETAHLGKSDPNRKLPCINTDRHALAVLIYMYLFLRHPLRGDKVHDVDDPQRDEDLSMGINALFVEHAQDKSNRIDSRQVKDSELPWKDTEKLPYKVAGPYLSTLFERAFISGLHEPSLRPTADEWESALVKTVDLIQPCLNPQCQQKWYVFDNTQAPKCPFCNTPFKGKLPILNLYSNLHGGSFKPDNHRLMIYTGQSLFKWHIDRKVIPNERLSAVDRQRVGYFIFHDNQWLLVNEKMPALFNVKENKAIAIGEVVPLVEGGQLLFAKDQEEGRLAAVQLVSVALMT